MQAIHQKSLFDTILEQTFPDLYQKALPDSTHSCEGLPDGQLSGPAQSKINELISDFQRFRQEAADFKQELSDAGQRCAEMNQSSVSDLLSTYGLITMVDIPVRSMQIPEPSGNAFINIHDCIARMVSASPDFKAPPPERRNAQSSTAAAPLQMSSDDLEHSRNLLQRMKSKQDYLRSPLYDFGRYNGPICVCSPSKIEFIDDLPSCTQVMVLNPTPTSVRYQIVRPRSPMLQVIMSTKNEGQLAPGMSMKFRVYYRGRSKLLSDDVHDQIQICSCQSADVHILPVVVQVRHRVCQIPDGAEMPTGLQ